MQLPWRAPASSDFKRPAVWSRSTHTWPYLSHTPFTMVRARWCHERLHELEGQAGKLEVALPPSRTTLVIPMCSCNDGQTLPSYLARHEGWALVTGIHAGTIGGRLWQTSYSNASKSKMCRQMTKQRKIAVSCPFLQRVLSRSSCSCAGS